MRVWTAEPLGQPQTGPRSGKWGEISKGLGPTTALSHTQDTVGCKKSYQFPAVRCIQPFHHPLLFSTTWINKRLRNGPEGRKRTKKEREGFLWFLFTSCNTSFMSPQFTWPWRAARKEKKARPALLIFIVLHLLQLMGNEVWADEVTPRKLYHLCLHAEPFGVPIYLCFG